MNAFTRTPHNDRPIVVLLTRYDNMTDEQLGCPHHKQLTEQEERLLRSIATWDDEHRIVIERSGSIDIYEVEHDNAEART